MTTTIFEDVYYARIRIIENSWVKYDNKSKKPIYKKNSTDLYWNNINEGKNEGFKEFLFNRCTSLPVLGDNGYDCYTLTELDANDSVSKTRFEDDRTLALTELNAPNNKEYNTVTFSVTTDGVQIKWSNVEFHDDNNTNQRTPVITEGSTCVLPHTSHFVKYLYGELKQYTKICLTMMCAKSSSAIKARRIKNNPLYDAFSLQFLLGYYQNILPTGQLYLTLKSGPSTSISNVLEIHSVTVGLPARVAQGLGSNGEGLSYHIEQAVQEVNGSNRSITKTFYEMKELTGGKLRFNNIWYGKRTVETIPTLSTLSIEQ